MCFYWENLKKQIRIVGKGKICDERDSDDYFSTRLRGSQIGAWASKQSTENKNRSYILKKFDEYSKKFENKLVPRPKYWSGFLLSPKRIEFWKDVEGRLHQRLEYSKDLNLWKKQVLYP